LPRTAAVEGYVHKFRFEADVAIVQPQALAAATEFPGSESQPKLAKKERRLLWGFVASVIGLSGLLIGIVWLLQ